MKALIKILPYLIIMFLCFRIMYLNNKNIKLVDSNAKLSEKLKKQVIIYKDRIISKERVNTVTGTEIKQETVYVPIDGKIEILAPEEGNKLDLNLIDKIFNHIIKQEDGSIILVKDKGFTIAPEISALYSDKLELGLQLKLFYWSRYNFGLGITNNEVLYGYVARNISDIIPIIHNTSIQASFGKDLKNSDTKFLFGLNVRL